MKALKDYPIVYEQKVAWGDMDAFGHLNNVIYYRYMESARIFYFDQLNVFAEDVLTVISTNQCKYLKPVFYPDVLLIGVKIIEMRNSAFRMHYYLFSQNQNENVAEGDAVVVIVDKKEMKKALIPEGLRKKIIALEQTVGNDLN